MAQRGTAQGTPSLDTNAGLTPKVAIVNPDGTPTMFFFRWLLTSGGKIISTAQTADDLESLEPFDAGADFALATAALDDARSAGEIAGAFADTQPAPAGDVAALETQALFADRAPAAEAAAEDAALAAWVADRAPVALAPPLTRDVLANIPTGLNAGDVGRTFYATDYQHTWRWTGTAWVFGDSELGSGFIQWFMVTPRAGKWQLCDGSTGVSESRADGTIAPVNFPGLASGTMPDLRGVYVRGAAAASGVVVPASSSAMTVGPADVLPAGGSVAAGTGTPVNVLTGLGNNPHTHSITGPPEPGHADAMPYYRL
jgi:hypothetical protein